MTSSSIEADKIHEKLDKLRKEIRLYEDHLVCIGPAIRSLRRNGSELAYEQRCAIHNL